MSLLSRESIASIFFIAVLSQLFNDAHFQPRYVLPSESLQAARRVLSYRILLLLQVPTSETSGLLPVHRDHPASTSNYNASSQRGRHRRTLSSRTSSSSSSASSFLEFPARPRTEGVRRDYELPSSSRSTSLVTIGQYLIP